MMCNGKFRVRFLSLMLICCLSFYSVNITVNAETIFNVWSLLKISDETTHYSEEEIDEIVGNYTQVQRNNLYAQLAKELAENNENSDISKSKAELIQRMDEAVEELNRAFLACDTVTKVFEAKSKIENITAEMVKLKEETQLDYIFQDNEYASDYQKVLEFQDNSFDIGRVGTGIKSPTSSGFNLCRLEGKCTDWYDINTVTYHTGMDLYANEGADLYAQFNGVIKDVYYSAEDGNVIELQSGSHLLIKYKHVGQVLVNKGTVVKQYDLIGYVGNTGSKSIGPHVHIEIWLDGVSVQPILLYGQMGIEALQKWYKKNPNTFIDVRKLLDNFDTTVQKESEVIEYKGFYDPAPTIDQSIIDEAIEQGLYPEGYTDTTIGFSGKIPNDLQKLIGEMEGAADDTVVAEE